MNDEVEQIEEEQAEPSLRDTLEAAINEAEESTAPEGQDTAEPVAASAEAPEGRTRDEHGRFAAKETAEAAHPGARPDPAAGSPAVEPGAEPPAALKPPISWKALAREAWAELPAAVQAEVSRREREIDQRLNESAEMRKMGERLAQVAEPFREFIAAEGSDPVTAAHNMFQTAAQLRVGTPGQKAQLIAHLVNQFGVDVQLLDRSLAGQGIPQQAMQPQQPLHDPRLDQLLAARAVARAAKDAEVQANADQEVASFGEGHEFFEDVREVMADLVESAQRRGQNLSLEQAYEKACRIDDGISAILSQRAQAQAAATTQQRTAAARRAASSVRGNPAGAPPSDGSALSRREAILAAMDEAGS
jgi:hypothetical protein